MYPNLSAQFCSVGCRMYLMAYPPQIPPTNSSRPALAPGSRRLVSKFQSSGNRLRLVRFVDGRLPVASSVSLHCRLTSGSMAPL